MIETLIYFWARLYSTAEAARRFRLDADAADGPLGLVVVERHTEITHEESDAGLQSLQTLN